MTPEQEDIRDEPKKANTEDGWILVIFVILFAAAFILTKALGG